MSEMRLLPYPMHQGLVCPSLRAVLGGKLLHLTPTSCSCISFSWKQQHREVGRASPPCLDNASS